MNAKKKKSKRLRSPRFPGIGLKHAIDSCRLFDEAAGAEACPPAELLTAIGYQPGSGPGNIAIAAMKSFGLLHKSKGGFALTDLAFEILKGSASKPAIDAMKTAAMMPSIFRQIWEQHGALKHVQDWNEARRLLLDHGFTKSGADRCLLNYERTLLFAQMKSPAPSGEDSLVEASFSFGNDIAASLIVYREHLSPSEWDQLLNELKSQRWRFVDDGR